VTHKLRNCRAF